MNALRLFGFKAHLIGHVFPYFDNDSLEEEYLKKQKEHQHTYYNLFLNIFLCATIFELIGQHSCHSFKPSTAKIILVLLSLVTSAYLKYMQRFAKKQSQLLLIINSLIINMVIMEKYAQWDRSVMGYILCSEADFQSVMFTFQLFADFNFSRHVRIGIKQNSIIAALNIVYSFGRNCFTKKNSFVGATAITYLTLKFIVLVFIHILEMIDRTNFLLSKERESDNISWQTLFLDTQNPIVILNNSGVVFCNNDFLRSFKITTSENNKTSDTEQVLEHLINGEKSLKSIIGEFATIDGCNLNRRKSRSLGTFTYEHNSLSLSFEVSFKQLCWKFTSSIYLNFKDITDTIIKQKEELSKRYRDILITTTSHELRNPLNAIMGSLELLRFGSSINGNEKSILVEAIKANSELLTNVINCLSDYCKYEAGTLELEIREFSLKDLIAECTSLFHYQSESRKISLSYNVSADSPSIVRSDLNRIKQIILNLISNSIKYTSKGTVSINVTTEQNEIVIAVADSGKGIDLSTKSTLFKLFGRVGEKSEGMDSGARAGLGLTISQALAKMIGSGITFTSEPNVGSVFKFTVKQVNSVFLRGCATPLSNNNNRYELLSCLDSMPSKLYETSHRGFKISQIQSNLLGASPKRFLKSISVNETKISTLLENEKKTEIIEVDEEQIDGDDISNEMTSEEEVKKNISVCTLQHLHKNPFYCSKTKSVSVISVPRLKECDCKPIIIVDDSSFNLMVLEGFIRKIGLTVAKAFNGKEGCAIMERQSKCKCNTLKCILTDCEMPIMNGFEFAAEIRKKIAEDRWKKVPIMAVTAYSDEGTREKCASSGMDDYLVKPVKLDELWAKLKEYHIA